MKNLLVVFLLFVGFSSFFSCGSSVDCSDEAALQAEIEPELDALLAATTAYALDQSSDNCNAYKSAINDYLDALKDLEDCVESEDQADFDEAVEELETQVDALSC